MVLAHPEIIGVDLVVIDPVFFIWPSPFHFPLVVLTADAAVSPELGEMIQKVRAYGSKRPVPAKLGTSFPPLSMSGNFTRNATSRFTPKSEKNASMGKMQVETDAGSRAGGGRTVTGANALQKLMDVVNEDLNAGRSAGRWGGCAAISINVIMDTGIGAEEITSTPSQKDLERDSPQSLREN